MGHRRLPSTDYGTVLLHFVLVAAVVVLLATGLRIATDDPAMAWIAVLDPVLPTGHLWRNHLIAAVVLMAVLVAYACYVAAARLVNRITPDRARLAAIVSPGRARWAGLNVCVFWVLMLSLVIEIVSGIALFAGYGGFWFALHRTFTWVLLACIGAHVALHAAFGGWSQLLRIFRPARLHIAPPPPDFAELLANHLARQAALPDEAKQPPGRGPADAVRSGQQRMPHRTVPHVTINAHPLVTAVVAAVFVGGAAIGAEHATRETLHVAEIAKANAPILDGDLSDPVWSRAVAVEVLTTQGGDFGGTGQTRVEIRAVHDGEFIYLAVVWDDPTRSLKHQPLVKRDGIWHVAASRPDLGDEQTFHEDKFAVLLTRPTLPLIGAAIHLAREPIAGRPGSTTGRGLHFTVDGSIADIWQWRASHGGPDGHVDNCHFGGARDPARTEVSPAAHYAGGFACDPGPVNHESNLAETRSSEGARILLPRRLPVDLVAMTAALGRISANADESESEGARWWMTHSESIDYSPERDGQVPDGTVIPSILVPDRAEASRASIRGAARWAGGRWTLELARRLYTGSRFDVPVKTGTLLWVAAFDHAEKRHTRHLRPFRLEVD